MRIYGAASVRTFYPSDYHISAHWLSGNSLAQAVPSFGRGVFYIEHCCAFAEKPSIYKFYVDVFSSGNTPRIAVFLKTGVLIEIYGRVHQLFKILCGCRGRNLRLIVAKYSARLFGLCLDSLILFILIQIDVECFFRMRRDVSNFKNHIAGSQKKRNLLIVDKCGKRFRVVVCVGYPVYWDYNKRVLFALLGEVK